MPQLADRVKETCAAPGVGNITLLGAAAGFQSFNTAFPGGGVLVDYCIVDQSGTNWETGTGLFVATDSLVRSKVSASSNGNALVNFSAGTQDVFVTTVAAHIKHSTLGRISAQARGLALP